MGIRGWGGGLCHLPQVSVAQDSVLFQGRHREDHTKTKDEWKDVIGSHSPNILTLTSRNGLTTRGATRFGGSHSHRPEPVTLVQPMSRLVPHPPAIHAASMVEKRRLWHARKKAGERTHRGEKRTGRQYPVGVWTRQSACPDPTVAAYPSRVEQPPGRWLGRTCPGATDRPSARQYLPRSRKGSIRRRLTGLRAMHTPALDALDIH